MPPPLAVLVKAVAAAAEGCAAPFFVLSPERAAADHPYPHAPQDDPFRAAHLQHGLGRSFRLLLGPWPSALGPWSSAPLSRRGLKGAPGESTSSSGIPNGLLFPWQFLSPPPPAPLEGRFGRLPTEHAIRRVVGEERLRKKPLIIPVLVVLHSHRGLGGLAGEWSDTLSLFEPTRSAFVTNCCDSYSFDSRLGP